MYRQREVIYPLDGKTTSAQWRQSSRGSSAIRQATNLSTISWTCLNISRYISIWHSDVYNSHSRSFNFENFEEYSNSGSPINEMISINMKLSVEVEELTWDNRRRLIRLPGHNRWWHRQDHHETTDSLSACDKLCVDTYTQLIQSQSSFMHDEIVRCIMSCESMRSLRLEIYDKSSYNDSRTPDDIKNM